MKHLALIAILAASMTAPAFAQSGSTLPVPQNPLIDYSGYLRLAAQTQPIRAQRLLTLTAFKANAAKTGAIILDARSAQAFEEGHMAGAVNLPLPDFNAASLRAIIGNNPDRTIMIYCNNNFTNNIRPIPTKVVQVALNIQTFINLRAYGYNNVWELGEAVDVTHPAVGWVGTRSTSTGIGLGLAPSRKTSSR